MKRVALFAFQGDPVCFIHVLLNALDLAGRGHQATIVMEGSATALIPAMAGAEHPLHGLYSKAKNQGLFAGVCRACATKLGVFDAALAAGFTPLDDMNGHPSVARFLDDDFEVLIF